MRVLLATCLLLMQAVSFIKALSSLLNKALVIIFPNLFCNISTASEWLCNLSGADLGIT